MVIPMPKERAVATNMRPTDHGSAGLTISQAVVGNFASE